jgi:hypothetical protein
MGIVLDMVPIAEKCQKIITLLYQQRPQDLA